MDIVQFFNKEKRNYPQLYKDKYFPDYLNNRFNKYQKNIELLNDDLINNKDEIIDKVKKLCNAIKKTIEKYYLGFVSEAFSIFNKELKSIENSLKTYYKSLSINDYSTLKYLYRIRSNTEAVTKNNHNLERLGITE